MDNNINNLMVVIPIGKQNAIHQIDLAEKIGIKPALVKKYVQVARRNGLNVCSGQKGYWLAESDDDLKEFETMLRKQALSRLKTTKPIRDSLKEYKGQMSLADTLECVSEGVRRDEQTEQIRI